MDLQLSYFQFTAFPHCKLFVKITSAVIPAPVYKSPLKPAPVASIGHHLCYKWSQKEPPHLYLCLSLSVCLSPPLTHTHTQTNREKGKRCHKLWDLKQHPDNLTATGLYYFIAWVQNNAWLLQRVLCLHHTCTLNQHSSGCYFHLGQLSVQIFLP